MSLLLSTIVGGYSFVSFAQVCSISLDVVRVLMLNRDKRFLAAGIGFVEVTPVYSGYRQGFVGGINDPYKITAYAGGYAAGNIAGSLIGSRLALGYLSMQVFPEKHVVDRLPGILRAAGIPCGYNILQRFVRNFLHAGHVQ